MVFRLYREFSLSSSFSHIYNEFWTVPTVPSAVSLSLFLSSSSSSYIYKDFWTVLSVSSQSVCGVVNGCVCVCVCVCVPPICSVVPLIVNIT